MKKKVIIFDCFGVIISNVLGVWFKDHIGDSQKDKEDFKHYALLQDLGKLSEYDVIIKLAQRVGNTPDRVEKEIESYFHVNYSLIEYIKNLKNKGYTLAILTNAAHDFFDRKIYVSCPWFKNLFDLIVISSLVNMVKPNPEIYEYTLQQLNISASEAVFIDDSLNNVKGAENVGIQSILYTNLENLIDDLEKLDIKV